MKVRILLERLKKGENIKGIANELAVSPSTISRKLKKLGYTWDNSTKVWNWNKEEDQPLEHNLFQNTISDKPAINSHASEKKVNNVSPIIHTQFTSDEVAALKNMLKEWQGGHPITKETETLYKRIKSIVNEDKARKTIVINKSITDRLDAFSESEKVNKSDVIELALIDFFEKYSKS